MAFSLHPCAQVKNVKSYFFIFILSLSSLSSAKIIVISDVDDTIRNTHIRPQTHGKRAKLKQAKAFIQGARDPNSFLGMPNLYAAMTSNEIEIQYVSSAPEWVSFWPRKFIQAFFPEGKIWNRKSIRIHPEEYKVETIAQIMKDHPKDEFILIGDNGERDAFVFQKIQNHPHLGHQVKGVFVHQLYSTEIGTPIFENQTSFLFGADLALHLYLIGALSDEQLGLVLKKIKNHLSFEKQNSEKIIPHFMWDGFDPEKFEQNKNLLQSPSLQTKFEEIVAQLGRLKKISCQRVFQSTLGRK